MLIAIDCHPDVFCSVSDFAIAAAFSVDRLKRRTVGAQLSAGCRVRPALAVTESTSTGSDSFSGSMTDYGRSMHHCAGSVWLPQAALAWKAVENVLGSPSQLACIRERKAGSRQKPLYTMKAGPWPGGAVKPQPRGSALWLTRLNGQSLANHNGDDAKTATDDLGVEAASPRCGDDWSMTFRLCSPASIMRRRLKAFHGAVSGTSLRISESAKGSFFFIVSFCQEHAMVTRRRLTCGVCQGKQPSHSPRLAPVCESTRQFV